MKKLTDSELLEELNRRFKENKEAFDSMRVMTKKLEKLNLKLQESEGLKSNFLSNIRNEINNPLTSIMCMSQELLSGEQLDGELVSSMANMIHSEAFALDFQLRNIFAAAEFEAGEAALSISSVDVDDLIKSTIEHFTHTTDRKEIKIVCDRRNGTGDDLHFNTDPEKLQIIISNLLGNAIEFSHEGGVVELVVARSAGGLDISFQDYGVGMDISNTDNVFDRFRQLDTGVTKSHLGHGLGLSITKATVELLNGTVSIQCEKERGCLFQVFIPEADIGSEPDMHSNNGNEFIFEEIEEY